MAYRKLSLKFHPDVNGGDEYFASHFREINEAYEALIDPVKRTNYDRQFSAAQQNPGSSYQNNFIPVIEYFKVDKTEFEFGEQVTFIWKTINANKVILKPFGSVPPIGKKTYKINDFRNKSLKFELIATNTLIEKNVYSSLSLLNITYNELYKQFKHSIEKEKVQSSSTTEAKDESNVDEIIHGNKNEELLVAIIIPAIIFIAGLLLLYFGVI